MNSLRQEKRIIFTGTPGSGKTSVIKELENQGYRVIYEAATDVIANEQALGIECPWEKNDFTDKILHLQKKRQMNAQAFDNNRGLQFYDRSPFCTYVLGEYLSQCKNIEFVPSSLLLEEIDRCLKTKAYQNKVFFFENLGFVEQTDARKISFEEAIIFEQLHLDIYKHFGFELIMVPKATIEERCEFVLLRIA